MGLYNRKCPYCGTENKNLCLEDSEGRMECSHCLRITQFPGFRADTLNLTAVYRSNSIRKAAAS